MSNLAHLSAITSAMVRPCRFDLSVCVTWSGPKKKVWKKKKIDFNNKHGLQVFIWALQVGMRLVNAWQTL
jgi:hypothetical protein